MLGYSIEMEDNVSRIKDRLDIIDVVGSYVKLQKSGINYKGRCPFHNEKTPSFYVSPDRQSWKCFGCSLGGDAFTFIQQIEGVEFPEALRILAQKAGVELKYDATQKVKADEKTPLYEICELATKFFEKQLHNSSMGNKASQYLAERGVKTETIQEFRLGFAPADWHSLGNFLKSQGYSQKDIVASGVSIKKDGTDDIYDRFRSRIIFPITDPQDRIVGFSGRIFEPGDKGLAKEGESVAKYINTPQTLIYDKSRIIYGLSKAKLEIKKADQCILVEGNMDALMSHQAGVKYAVASSGTALTPYHLRLLQRFTNNLGFCFDTDQAGNLATRRGIGLALANNFNIRVVAIDDKECKDPADYVQKHGPKWSDIVQKSKPVINFYFDRAKESFDPSSAEHKKTMLAVVAPFIKRLASSIEKSHWVNQLAMLFRVKEEAVQEDLNRAKDDLEQYDDRSLVEEKYIPLPELNIDGLSETILALALKHPEGYKAQKDIDHSLLHPVVASVLTKLKDSNASLKEFMAGFKGPEATAISFASIRGEEFWKDTGKKEIGEELAKAIRLVKKRAIGVELVKLEYDIKAAEALKDSKKLNELASKFSQLAGELSQIENI